MRAEGSSAAVKRPAVRTCLMVGLVVAAAFAVWSWLRPYARDPDPRAGGRIIATMVTRDHSFFWVETHVKLNPAVHDRTRPVALETKTGKRIQPADTRFRMPSDDSELEAWYKFWVDTGEIAGPLSLHLNDGTLVVKSDVGVPKVSEGGFHTFSTKNW